MTLLSWISDPSNLTAVSTAVIAVFTVVLAVVAGIQGWLISKQIKLARDEFISSHRPRIILRDVSRDGQDILYMLVNDGGTKCTIKESWITTESIPPNRAARTLRSAGHNDLGHLTFAPGEMKDLTY